MLVAVPESIRGRSITYMMRASLIGWRGSKCSLAKSVFTKAKPSALVSATEEFRIETLLHNTGLEMIIYFPSIELSSTQTPHNEKQGIANEDKGRRGP